MSNLSDKLTYQGFSLKDDAIIPLVRSFKSAGLFDVTVLPFPPTLSQQQSNVHDRCTGRD
jgi:hypothetical protein